MTDQKIKAANTAVAIENSAIDTKDLVNNIELRKKEQIELVESNPFIKVEDNKTYELAKVSRTALVKGRTKLSSEKKTITSELNYFKKAVTDAYDEMILITFPAEQKQQEEVKRYEARKAAEKVEKERIEAERQQAIKMNISSFFVDLINLINGAVLETIEGVNTEVLKRLTEYDKSSCGTHLDFFLEKESEIHSLGDQKMLQLKKDEEARIALENERIAREKAQAEKEEADKKAAAEKAIADEVAKKLREEKEAQEEENRKIKAELQKLQDEKKAAERKEQKRKEAEKAEKDRIEAEKIAKEIADAEAERLEALKPDVEKAELSIESIRVIPVDGIKNKSIQEFVANIENEIIDLKNRLIQELKSI